MNQLHDQPTTTLRFLTGWHQVQEGAIRPGGTFTIEYDLDRLPQCRLSVGGRVFWGLEVFVRFHPDGQGLSESLIDIITPEGQLPAIAVPRPVQVSAPLNSQAVEMWFRNFNGGGSFCESWDSRFGQNYWFEVEAQAESW